LLGTVYSLLARGVSLVMEYNDSREFAMSEDHLEKFASRWLLHSLLWGLGGSMNWKRRTELGELLLAHCNVPVPSGRNLCDLQVRHLKHCETES
jgi:dynein heavy chain 1